ncbi:MAG TPA: pyridoxal phosphate-dependent aminotransferase, partial [Candidatus Babeliales bacterium]|nr:pyridoxal phosphate-dependent aminotransferase [Candidatus Babeliales bacterium]
LSNNKPTWFFDKSMLEAAVTPRTKMLIIAHPSNPCGVSLTQHELNELSNWCEQKGIYCIIDEAYDNYFFDTEPTSSTALISQGKFTIRTGSFSKMFGMSGWRVGFVVAPEHVINHIAGVQDGLIVCPTVISQYAALYALQHTEIAKAYTTYMHRNRDIANELLQPLMDEGIISFAKPSAGFFMFLQTQEQDTTQLAYNLLNQAQVAIVPGRNFGPSGKPFLRLCYARRQEQVIQGIERLVTFLR